MDDEGRADVADVVDAAVAERVAVDDASDRLDPAIGEDAQSHGRGDAVADLAWRLPQAQQRLQLFPDGGVWMWNIHKDRFKKGSEAMLDFYQRGVNFLPVGWFPSSVLISPFP